MSTVGILAHPVDASRRACPRRARGRRRRTTTTTSPLRPAAELLAREHARDRNVSPGHDRLGALLALLRSTPSTHSPRDARRRAGWRARRASPDRQAVGSASVRPIRIPRAPRLRGQELAFQRAGAPRDSRHPRARSPRAARWHRCSSGPRACATATSFWKAGVTPATPGTCLELARRILDRAARTDLDLGLPLAVRAAGAPEQGVVVEREDADDRRDADRDAGDREERAPGLLAQAAQGDRGGESHGPSERRA